MKSRIAEAIRLETKPVALIWTDEGPDNAIQFQPRRWGCAVSLFAAAATRGVTGVFDRQTYGCWGGGVGLGFGNQYENFPGGTECFCKFLSTGNEDSELGRTVGEQLKTSGFGRMTEDFLRGERYLKSPDAAGRFLESLAMADIPAKFVVAKPLDQVDLDKDKVKSITFFVDPDRLSALVQLASFEKPESENVIVPWAAGCQVFGIFAYRELERDHPRGLVGMIDLSARRNVRATLGESILSFTAPEPLFRVMETNVEGSFLQREVWQSLIQSKA
jgi:hypothetical protein